MTASCEFFRFGTHNSYSFVENVVLHRGNSNLMSQFSSCSCWIFLVFKNYFLVRMLFWKAWRTDIFVKSFSFLVLTFLKHVFLTYVYGSKFYFRGLLLQE